MARPSRHPKPKGYVTHHLTRRQEHFARLIALDGLTQAEAYRQAYSATNQSPETIYPSASILANHNPKVVARIAELKQTLASQAVLTASDLISKLKEIGFVVPDKPRIRPADQVAAIDKIAKILGLYRDIEPERQRPVVTQVTVVLDHGRGLETRVVEGKLGDEKPALSTGLDYDNRRGVDKGVDVDDSPKL